MVQGKINRGRHTDHPAGRHSIRTNQCPPPLSPIFYRPDALPAAQPTASKHWRQLALLLLTDSQKTGNGCHDDEDAQLLRNFRTRRFEINLTVTWRFKYLLYFVLKVIYIDGTNVHDLITIQKDRPTLSGRDCGSNEIEEIGSANLNIIRYTTISPLNWLFLYVFLHVISSSKIPLIEVWCVFLWSRSVKFHYLNRRSSSAYNAEACFCCFYVLVREIQFMLYER